MSAEVFKLFVKPDTDVEMVRKKSIDVKDLNIVNQKKSQPFRSVLIVSKELLDYWKVKPSSFRENIVVNNFDISKLESGDEVKIGEVRIRITTFCEPCKKMTHIASLEKLKFKRGILGEFLNDGRINVGDTLKIIKKRKHEVVPYEYYDRVNWYLTKKTKGKIKASELLWNAGVSQGLIRVLPQIMKNYKFKSEDISRVIFVTHK